MNPTSPTDDLTGALIRDSFEAIFSAELEKAAKSGQPLSMVATDIDHFLLINQEHGHRVGDAVLKQLAAILMTGAGENGLVFRYGGDEFYLLLPNTSREQALLAMERLRLEVSQPRKYDGAEFEVCISAGIASYPIDSTASDELQRKADQALYRAKQAGRSQVLLAYDEKMVPKTIHFTETQLERLTKLAEELAVSEARLMREALDELIKKYTVNQIPRG